MLLSPCFNQKHLDIQLQEISSILKIFSSSFIKFALESKRSSECSVSSASWSNSTILFQDISFPILRMAKTGLVPFFNCKFLSKNKSGLPKGVHQFLSNSSCQVLQPCIFELKVRGLSRPTAAFKDYWTVIQDDTWILDWLFAPNRSSHSEEYKNLSILELELFLDRVYKFHVLPINQTAA